MASRSRVLQRSLLNLVLSVTLGVLLTVVYLRPGPDADNGNGALLTELDPQTVTRIMLERPDQLRLVFERKDDEWRLTEPIRVLADGSRVGELLAVLEQKSFSRYPVSGLDLAKFGLDSPVMTAHFDQVHLSIGGTNPIGHRRYVLQADQVHLVANTVSHLMQTEAASFVTLRLLPTKTPIAELIMPSIVVTRSAHGWHAVPTQPAVQKEAWEELVDAWINATALSAETYTAKRTTQHVDIHFEDGSSVRFDIVERAPTLLLARADLGVQYRLAPGMTSRLLSPGPQAEESQ